MSDKKYKVVNGTHYDERTPDEVIRILEHSRRTKQRLIISYGDPTTLKFWENVRGCVGRSVGGDKPIPLLIRTSRSLGGEAILDYCIIEIAESPSRKLLYKAVKE